MVWSNLYTPELRANVIKGLAWVATIFFFLLWNIPVIAVQSLASIEGIKDLCTSLGLHGLRNYLDGLSHAEIAT